MVAYSFEGWNAHQSLGMLITRRMESAGSSRWASSPTIMASPATGSSRSATQRRCFRPISWSANSSNGSRISYLLKTAFREVAVIGGLVERQHPGRARPAGRSASRPTSSTTSCAATSPQHLLLRAAWDDARARMTELGRLVRLVDRAAATMVHVEADRITPMAVPDGDRRARGASARHAGRRNAPRQAEQLAKKRCPLISIAARYRICESAPCEIRRPSPARAAAWRLRRENRREAPRSPSSLCR
jgi:Lhr-like helicase